MEMLSQKELENLELVTDEQIYEYRIELAKAKARFDAELYYRNSLTLRKTNAQKSFLYSFLLGLVGICIGFWINS
jgi:hypothetical protein